MNLASEIVKRAGVDGDLIKVDDFLNHRVEPEVLGRVGEAVASMSQSYEPDLIVTAEASGIPPAAAASLATGLPYVYAKKLVHPSGRPIEHTALSRTKGMEITLRINPRAVVGSSRVVLVDDFLAHGSTALALIAMMAEADLEVAALCVVIDKPYEGGRAIVEAAGVPVHAVLEVASIDGGVITRGGA